jgi:hypothetical protein
MNPLCTVYKINGSMLEKPDSIRDLGVTFNSKLSFNVHIDLVAQSAFKSLGFIMRNSREISDADTLKTLYVTYVRSRLEYSSLVWSLIYNNHISTLERVQRRFLKAVACSVDGVYPPRGYPQELLLERFNLVLLVSRRVEHSIISCIKFCIIYMIALIYYLRSLYELLDLIPELKVYFTFRLSELM